MKSTAASVVAYIRGATAGLATNPAEAESSLPAAGRRGRERPTRGSDVQGTGRPPRVQIGGLVFIRQPVQTVRAIRHGRKDW